MKQGPLRITPSEGSYIDVPNQPLSIEDAVSWINELNARENKAWLWIMRNRWNVGLIAKHLNVIYGKNTLENFAEKIDMPITTVRECLQLVKKFKGDVSLYEALIITPNPFSGRPIRWMHIQKLVKSDVNPEVLGAEALARRLCARIEENTKSLAALNDLARQLPEAEAGEVYATADGLETSFTAELVDFVSSGHKVLDDNAFSGDGAASRAEAEVMVRKLVMHRLKQTPDKGSALQARTREQALEEALIVLGYTVTEVSQRIS